MLDYWKVIDFSCEICENTSFAVAPFLEMGTYIRSCWKTYSPWRWFYLHNLQNVGWTSPFWRGVNLPQKTDMDTQNYDLEEVTPFQYGHFWFYIIFMGCTLQGTNISHLGKRKIIFKIAFSGDMLVSGREFFVNTVLSSMESEVCGWYRPFFEESVTVFHPQVSIRKIYPPNVPIVFFGFCFWDSPTTCRWFA